MTTPLTTRDALAKTLASTWIDGPQGRRLIRAEYGEAACEDFADALLASGALTDATKLAEDEALMFRMGAIQVDLEPGYEPGAKLRQTITQQAAADVRALTAALSAQSERAEVER